MGDGITQSGASEEEHRQGEPWRNRDTGRQQDGILSNCGASASVADTGMVTEAQMDDGREGTTTHQVQHFKAASDWFLACVRGDWGPDSSPLRYVSSATTLFVSNLSCWTKHLSNVSFLSPAILSQVPPSSLCLAYTTIPQTWQPSTSQTELLPCCSLLHLSLTAYLQICLFP